MHRFLFPASHFFILGLGVVYKKIIKENYFATFCNSNHYCDGQQSTNNIKKFSLTI
jgi:hypothetical protein